MLWSDGYKILKTYVIQTTYGIKIWYGLNIGVKLVETYTNTNLLKYKTCYKEGTKVHTLIPTSLYINQKGFSGKKHDLITDLYF